MSELPPVGKEDKGRLLLLSYLTMKFEVDRLPPNTSEEEYMTFRLKQNVTVELTKTTAEIDPDVCAMLEPLAVALILACPDIQMYAQPLRVLQLVAVAGRNWLSVNELTEEQRESNQRFVMESMKWLTNVAEVIQEKIGNGEGFSPMEMADFFSPEFQVGMAAFQKKRDEENKPPVIEELMSNALDDMRLEQMLASLDPEDIN